MKNLYKILAVLLVSVSFNSFYAQQGFAHIEVNTAQNKITFTTWDVANGTHPTNVDGPKYFGSSYSNLGYVFIYNQTTEKLYEPFNSTRVIVTNPDETIGNGMASYFDGYQYTSTDFRNTDNHSETFPLIFIQKAPTGTINGVPSTSPVEILKYVTIFEGINSLPDNTWIFHNSRSSSMYPSGSWDGFTTGVKKVNGIWTFPTKDPYNGPMPAVGTNPYTTGMGTVTITFNYTTDQQLATTDVNINKDKNIAYPNPVKDVLYFNEEVSNVKITDATGRKVKEFSTKEKSINVANLAKGVYIMTATTKDGNTVNQKVIKE